MVVRIDRLPPPPRWAVLALLAALYTGLDAVKPLTIDDAYYVSFARHLAADPLGDPYGFRETWYYHYEDANDILAPPVLPAWVALGMRLFGDDPTLWKLWLFPFALLFVAALHALFRRFCRGLELPLTVLTVLSPTFLPALNLMLDVPALALALAAIALALRACDRGRLAEGVFAAVLAGLATQTKYTGFLAPVAMTGYALLRRRWGLAALFVTLPAGLFAAWEGYVAYRHGASHFLHNLDAGGTFDDKVKNLGPLAGMLGGLAPAVFLLGIAAQLRNRWWTLAGGALVVAGFALLAAVPAESAVLSEDPTSHAERMSVDSLSVGLACAGLVLTTLAAGVRLGGRGFGWRAGAWRGRFGVADLFLIGWLGVEVAGMFALTTFPAARRVMGVVVVMTLLAGRVAARTCAERPRRRLVLGVTAFGVALGALYAGVDWWEAATRRDGAEAAAAAVREQDPRATVWYVGHWGFQFYAERAGMTAVDPYEPGVTLDGSTLRRDEWLVVPRIGVHHQPVVIDGGRLERVAELTWADRLPFSTVPCYYCGHQPLRHHQGPRVAVDLYRVSVPSYTAVRPPVEE
jgi:hypothetical protein